jgi:hypothetical protein
VQRRKESNLDVASERRVTLHVASEIRVTARSVGETRHSVCSVGETRRSACSVGETRHSSCIGAVCGCILTSVRFDITASVLMFRNDTRKNFIYYLFSENSPIVESVDAIFKVTNQ